jgi:multicomponent Na+:H+ antiporter subunit D
MYVFLEITAVASFVLISLYRDKDALEAAFKYFVLSAIATVLMLSSIALLLLISGDTGFSAINAAIITSQHSRFVMLAMGLFICGLFIKGGLMPFHGWLPDAYSAAPAPVSILLAGIVTKTVGIYALIRIVTLVFVFNDPIKYLLMFVGALSIVLGALAALGQSDFKRMLAYSSISQVGYIIIGLGCGTPLGIFGAVFHLLNHAIFKSLLFVNSAAVELETGSRDMDKMSGLAEKMPLTGITSVLAVLSTAGIPPLSGFWSKLIIIMALWISGYRIYAVVAVTASVITLAYFLSLQRRVFWGKLGKEFDHIKEPGFMLAFPALVLAFIIVAVGILFPYLVHEFINLKELTGG